MRIGIILQARMGSSRLPGKVAMSMAGKPMILRILERLSRVTLANALVVATSDTAGETPLLELVRSAGAKTFSGSESDVLDRYYQCAQAHGFDAIVRATGDNPFVDPQECDRLIELFLRQECDYACALPELGSGLPVGIGAEIFRFSALARSWREGGKPHHREHVNEFIHENPSLFRISVLKAPKRKTAPSLSFTVDTLEQFREAERLYLHHQAQGAGDGVTTEWLLEQRAP